MTNVTDGSGYTDDEFAQHVKGGQPVTAQLTTDGRILARITDGIYRLPGSALRELVSNSYDADATRVTISTDMPRFDRIVVEDNGNGMSVEALTNMLRHIGGSAKRSDKGERLEISDKADSSRSPAGRRLIGKLGIGLFSVAQLTRSFLIITKKRGEDKRSIARVVLKQYIDGDEPDGVDGQIESGLVTVWQESALSDQIDAHGTTIVLDSVRLTAKEKLRDLAMWNLVTQEKRSAPKYHIGHFLPDSGELSVFGNGHESLPWDIRQTADNKMSSMVKAIWKELEMGRSNSRLDLLFDHYLQMIYNLALAVPTQYVDGQPAEQDWYLERYLLEGDTPKSTSLIARGAQGWPSFDDTEVADFEIHIDGIQLSRPVSFENPPSTTHAVSRPLLFVGHLREEFDNRPKAFSGGPLEFTAYFVWSPKIAPVDNIGCLIRVHGASGTLFDPTFLRYQTAENTRLRQISCEIFVSEGLEAALNIDRESLNYTHPHAERLTSWLHAALGQVTNRQKSIAASLRKSARESKADEFANRLQKIVTEVSDNLDTDLGEPPQVRFFSGERKQSAADVQLDRDIIFSGEPVRTGKKFKADEQRVGAITQILFMWGMLDGLPESSKELLIRQIATVLRVEDQ